MSKILAFTNQKGGVGKTTSTANVGAGLARAGKRVLLVDLDPQANLTKGLGLRDAEQNVYRALLGEYRLKAYSLHENLALVAGSPALSGFEKVKGDELDREFLLKELLEPVRERCDYILLDCPPALGWSRSMPTPAPKPSISHWRRRCTPPTDWRKCWSWSAGCGGG